MNGNMDTLEKDAVSKKECSECTYCKKENYCIRKKREVKEQDYCLHYVNAYDLHSTMKLTTEIANYLRGSVK